MELDSTLVALEWTFGLASLGAVAARARMRVTSTRRKGVAVVAAVALVGLAALEWGKRIEPYFPEVTTSRVPLVHEPFRVVLLADLHAGRMSASDLAKAVSLANATSPDVVLLAGDYISGYEMIDERARALEGLRGLVAKHGVLAVMGNHDSEPYGDDTKRRDDVATRLRGFGYRVLANEALDLGAFWVVGLEDVQAGRTDVALARHAVPPGAKVVYLAHDWHALPRERLDLALVGHTHGGQVCVPFTDLCGAPSRDRPFVRGTYAWPHGGTLFVTRGVGLAKAPLRFACRPEVSVVELGGKN